MNFNAFCPLNGGQLDTYYRDDEYPYDLNASLDYMRPATGFSHFPFPVTIGYIDGLVPQMNAQEWRLWKGKLPTGPWQGETNMADLQRALNVAFPSITGGMRKVTG